MIPDRCVRPLLFFSLLLLAGLMAANVYADSEHYETLTSAPADYRASVATPLTSADSLVWDSPLSSGPVAARSVIPTKGNPTLYLRADFSVADATCVIYVGLYAKVGSTYTYLGPAGKQTLTAASSGGSTRNSRYLHEGFLAFDTGTATHVEVRKAAPSSGNISLYPWVGGSAPRGAGTD